MFKAMPDGNGPAYHTHDYVEIFLPLEGKWRFYWGNDPDAEPDGEEHSTLQPPALRFPHDLRADGAVCAQVPDLLPTVELCRRC